MRVVFLVNKWKIFLLYHKLCYNEIDMDDKQLTKISNSMKKKLGEEGFAKISDDIGLLITGNTSNLEELKKREEQINELKETNQQLITANGNLLKQVPMGSDEPDDSEKESKTEKIDLRKAFDANGNFIH